MLKIGQKFRWVQSRSAYSDVEIHSYSCRESNEIYPVAFKYKLKKSQQINLIYTKV